jgi:Asp-tRNA(Asn)/Glu-tRNA(Gln) amidotransferase A subunit family amidase
MVPLATGSQTAGSINRPASYCGVLGFKPTFGRYDRAGVKLMSATLDTAGTFARGVADLRLADLALTGQLLGARSGPPVLAFAAPSRDALEPDAAAAITTLVRSLELAEISLPGYARLAAAQELIQRAESARSLAPELREHPEQLSDALREALLAGAAIPHAELTAAFAVAAELGPALRAVLGRYDGVLVPSATGVPPRGLAFTGDPSFCRTWTLIGAPSLSVPLAWTPDGLPVGLQLVGAPRRDGELLSAAEWLLASGGA